MARMPGSGKSPQQAPGAAFPGSGIDRQAKTSGVALPADLDRSLRLLDDAQLDRLAKAVADEVRRRGRGAPDNPSVGDRSAKYFPAKAERAKPDKPTTVTAGQERLILAAWKAGLKPAMIAKEVRVSRSTALHVINDAQRDHRRTER